jgi:hypothetical protein
VVVHVGAVYPVSVLNDSLYFSPETVKERVGVELPYTTDADAGTIVSGAFSILKKAGT